MKFIFDFDDVLFHTNDINKFRGNIYSKLKRVGILPDSIKEYIEKERESKLAEIRKFDVIILGEVWDLLDTVDEKSKDKILYNIDKAKYVNDPELFKKLDDLIWEFRTKYKKTYYRLFSFWDKTDKTETLVVATHGIIKKTDKIPKIEIEKAKAIMKQYFEQKTKK